MFFKWSNFVFVRGHDGFVLFLLTFWKFESSLLRACSNKSPKILFPASIDCFGRGPAKRRWTRNRSPDLLDKKNIGAASEFREKKGEVLGMSIQRLFDETARLLGLFGLWHLKFSASGCCVIGSSKQSETCGNPALYRDHEFHCPNGNCSFLVARAVAVAGNMFSSMWLEDQAPFGAFTVISDPLRKWKEDVVPSAWRMPGEDFIHLFSWVKYRPGDTLLVFLFPTFCKDRNNCSQLYDIIWSFWQNISGQPSRLGSRSLAQPPSKCFNSRCPFQ